MSSNNSFINNGYREVNKKKGGIGFALFFNPLVALILAVAIIAVPLFVLYGGTLGADSVYDNVFVAALNDKVELLANTDEEKIAVIGGSSVAFGLDSELLEEYTEKKVVNFGLYSTLGSKVMLDLSREHMNEGDTVIFAPELDSETLSLYFGAKSVWQAIDVNHDLLSLVAKSDRKALLNTFMDYYNDKSEILKDGQIPDPSGIYNRKNFNDYGDISYPRPYNTMALGYDPNTVFSPDTSIISDEFIDYFNIYCEEMKDKGVTVYLSFCPINELCLEVGTSEEDILAFESCIASAVACPVISSLSDYIMNWGYFFDTNLHLNDAGVKARTKQLISDIYTYNGDFTKLDSITLPDPPGKESGNELIEGDNSFRDYFVFEEVATAGGEVLLAIVGLTDKALLNTHSEIAIPTSDGATMVYEIKAEVLADIPNLEKVYFYKNIKVMEDGIFAGCDSLKDVYLIDFGPANCNVSFLDPSNPTYRGLLTGANDDIRIHVESEYYDAFVSDYSWGHYASHYVSD